MTNKDNQHKGDRPKSAKGKAKAKTISTRLTLAEWKTVMRRITDEDYIIIVSFIRYSQCLPAIPQPLNDSLMSAKNESKGSE